jgi:simple sugar transport system ATP-binding protein
MTDSIPLVEARGISRSFGHVRALDNADFDVYAGEVVCLIGDNGAGKSTLVKALSGSLDIDDGQILYSGRVVELTSPAKASELGIETVYQDLALAPTCHRCRMYSWAVKRQGLGGWENSDSSTRLPCAQHASPHLMSSALRSRASRNQSHVRRAAPSRRTGKCPSVGKTSAVPR